MDVSSEFDKYGVIHSMMVKDVQKKMQNQQTILSEEFFCPEDPNSVGFKIGAKFGANSPGWLSVYLHPSRKDVTKHRVFMGVYDSAGLRLKSATSTEPSPIFGHGWKHLLEVNATTPSDLNIVVECQYAVVPDTSQSKASKLRAKFQSDLLRAFQSDTFQSDVTFHIQGEEIKAHKALLIARSNYFSAMFESDMKESESNKVEITDIQPKVFKDLLGFLYGSMPEERKSEEWMELFTVADKYNVQELKDLCEASIIRCLSLDNIFEALSLAGSHHCPKLRNRAEVIFKMHADILKKSEKWSTLKSNPELLLELLDCCTKRTA